MSQENSLFRHRVFIEDKEIISESEGNIDFSGNGQTNKLNLTVQNIDLQYDSLLNKKIEVFLNESGTDDALPIFRGFIRRYTPNEKNVKILALDVRSVLTGNEGIKISLTDTKNYDGKTLASFIYDIVTDKVNYDKTVIGLDMLKDSDVVARMTGTRGQNLDILNIINSKASSVIDKSDYNKPLGYFVDIVEGSDYSNIVIKKDIDIESAPSYTFSYGDGLQSLRYKKVFPTNTIYYNDGRELHYTSRPTGQVSKTITNVEDISEARKAGLEQILIDQQQNAEIDIDVTKCYDIGLGSLVFLDVPDDDVYGPQRVVGKKITFGKRMRCALKLNKKPIKVSDYIQQ